MMKQFFPTVLCWEIISHLSCVKTGFTVMEDDSIFGGAFFVQNCFQTMKLIAVKLEVIDIV